jgi:hypothetical protein
MFAIRLSPEEWTSEGFFPECSPDAHQLRSARAYQVPPVQAMSPACKLGSLFVDHEMGSGKTVVIELIAKMYVRCGLRVLVVCASSTNRDNLFADTSAFKGMVQLLTFKSIRGSGVDCGNNPVEMAYNFRRMLLGVRLVMVDEIHLVHKRDDTERFKGSAPSLFKNMTVFFELCAELGVKIVFLTGTPQHNRREHMVETLNLMLPKKIVDPHSDAELVEALRNRVSHYHSEQVRDQERRFYNEAGEFSAEPQYHVDVMAPEQRACARGRQGHLFAHERSIELIRNEELADPEFLRRHSALYYNLLRLMGVLPGGRDPRKVVFYYNDLNANEGNEFLQRLLAVYGVTVLSDGSRAAIDRLWRAVTSGSGLKEQVRRRAVLISSDYGVHSADSVNKLIEVYNHPLNKYGDYLSIMFGSRKLAVGHNFLNVRQLHILAMSNFADMEQAQARGLRNTDRFSGAENHVDIYRHVVYAGNGAPERFCGIVAQNKAHEQDIARVRDSFVAAALERLPLAPADSDLSFLIFGELAAKPAYTRALMALLVARGVRRIHFDDLYSRFLEFLRCNSGESHSRWAFAADLLSVCRAGLLLEGADKVVRRATIHFDVVCFLAEGERVRSLGDVLTESRRPCALTYETHLLAAHMPDKGVLPTTHLGLLGTFERDMVYPCMQQNKNRPITLATLDFRGRRLQVYIVRAGGHVVHNLLNVWASKPQSISLYFHQGLRVAKLDETRFSTADDHACQCWEREPTALDHYCTATLRKFVFGRRAEEVFGHLSNKHHDDASDAFELASDTCTIKYLGSASQRQSRKGQCLASQPLTRRLEIVRGLLGRPDEETLAAFNSRWPGRVDSVEGLVEFYEALVSDRRSFDRELVEQTFELLVFLC